MSKCIPILVAFHLAIPSLAVAGYGDLLGDWESYKPTSLYDSRVRPRPEGEIAPTKVDADFEAQVARIKEIKARWERALETMAEQEVFYTPNPNILDLLRPAASDPGGAKRALASDLTLEKLEILALLRNPGVKATQEKFLAALEAYNQIWNLDEILRQYTAFTEGLMTVVGPMKGREPVEKRFPFPGVLALKGEVVTQEVKAAWETSSIALRSAVTMARKSYWDLLFIHRAQEITEEMLGLLQHLETVATTRYEAGETSFQDVIKVRIQRETLHEDLNTLRKRQGNIEVKILEVLDLPPDIKMGAPMARRRQPDVPNLEALYGLALKNRQEVKRLEAQVGKMERMIEMAETAIYPTYTLNLSLFQDEAITQVGTTRLKEPFEVATKASMGAGLPKAPWYGANDAYLRETRKKLEALREELVKVRNNTIFQVREAWFRLDRASREETLYDESVVNLSQAALEVSTRGYETGKISFADVITSYTNWLQAKLVLERKRSDLGVAHAELEAAVGTHWK
jgi:hypothetical protein